MTHVPESVSFSPETTAYSPARLSSCRSQLTSHQRGTSERRRAIQLFHHRVIVFFDRGSLLSTLDRTYWKGHRPTATVLLTSALIRHCDVTFRSLVKASVEIFHVPANTGTNAVPAAFFHMSPRACKAVTSDAKPELIHHSA